MPTDNTTNKVTVPKNLTILCPPQIRDRLEQLATQEKRSKSQMAILLLDEAMTARNLSRTA